MWQKAGVHTYGSRRWKVEDWRDPAQGGEVCGLESIFVDKYLTTGWIGVVARGCEA